MQQLSEQQVELISAYIKQNGVAQNELHDDLLDHVCTSMENKLQQGASFEDAFQQTIKLFGPGGLKQVQQDTFELLTEMNETMKKVTFGFGLTSIFLLLAGTIFELQHWSGAGIMFVLGSALLTMVYLPLILRHKLKESPNNEAIMHISGFVGLAFTTLGSLFKIMHWPGASTLLMIGIGTLALLYVPIYFYKKYQTSVNKPITLSAALVAITCLILVFALTRVNNSVVYDDGVTIIDDHLRASTKRVSDNVALYKLLNGNADASRLKISADKTVEHLETLKAAIVATVDQLSDEKARSTPLSSVRNKSDFNIPTRLLFESNADNPLNVKQMVYRLDEFETEVMDLYPTSIREQLTTTFPIDTKQTFDVDGQQWNWSKYSFYRIPVVGVISYLSKLQYDVRQTENQALVYLISRPEASNPPS